MDHYQKGSKQLCSLISADLVRVPWRSSARRSLPRLKTILYNNNTYSESQHIQSTDYSSFRFRPSVQISSKYRLYPSSNTNSLFSHQNIFIECSGGGGGASSKEVPTTKKAKIENNYSEFKINKKVLN